MILIITRWLVITVSILLIAQFMSGIRVDSLLTALIAAGVLGLINVFLRPVVILLTLPLSILTLGVFTFFINAFLLELVSHMVSGFEVDGFLSAFLGSLVISVISWLANFFIAGSNTRKPKRQDVINMEKGNDGKWR